MQYTFRVGYRVLKNDKYEIVWGYVHARDKKEAWEKARKKFGDVRFVN